MTHPAISCEVVFRRRDGKLIRRDAYVGKECGIWEALVAANWYNTQIWCVDAYDADGEYITGFSIDR